MALNRQTKIKLNNERVEQTTGSTLNLSGTTIFDSGSTLTLLSNRGVGRVLTSNDDGVGRWVDIIGSGDTTVTTVGDEIRIFTEIPEFSAGDAIIKQITQSSHGFSVGDVIGFSGSTYNKAIASTSYDGEVLGVVNRIVDTNNFEFTQAGYITGLTGLVQGDTYFLSPLTAGLLTSTRPDEDGQIVNTMLFAATTTTGWVLPYPGFVVSTGDTTGIATIENIGQGIGIYDSIDGDVAKLRSIIGSGDTTVSLSGDTVVTHTPLSLHLDQTVQQTVTGGPKMDFINFNVDYVDGVSEGRLQWNPEDGTLEFGMPGGVVNLQIGQEQLIRVKNDSGALIEDGKVVKLSGGTGGFSRIGLADNTSIECMGAIGMTTEDIANGSFGYVTTRGMVRDIDTTGFAIGDIIWLSSGGTYTNIMPEAPLHKFIVGVIIKVDALEGIIYVSMQGIPPLSKLSDVYGEPTTTGQLYSWNQDNLRFELNENILNSITGATNGLSVSGRNVVLGGVLSESTTITANESNCLNLEITGSTFTGNTFVRLKNEEGENQAELRSGDAYVLASLNNGDVCCASLFINASKQLSISGCHGSLEFTNIENIFVDCRTAGSRKGLIYNADYSNDFVARSLIDKGYVDNEINGLTGTTSSALTGATNIGSGEEIYSSTSNRNLQLRSLVGSGDTIVSTVGDEIRIYTDAAVSFTGLTDTPNNYINTNYLRSTTNSIEYRTPAQVLSDIGAQPAGSYDNYVNWLLCANGISGTQSITSGNAAIFSGGSNITLTRTNNCIGISASVPTVNDSTITISGGTGLTTGGDFTLNQASDETITLNHTTYTARNISATGANIISCVVSDGIGHVTNVLCRALSASDISAEPSFSKGDLVASPDILLTGTTTGRLYGAGNVGICHCTSGWAAKTTLTGANVISNLTVNTQGHISDWTTRALTASDIDAATLTHVHGEITSGGTVSTNVTIASTDRLLITDASDGAKVKGGEAFGTSTVCYLANNGTWQTPAGTYSLPLAADGTRGGIQIGYSATGANIPLQLSSEKAYVVLTKAAIETVLTGEITSHTHDYASTTHVHGEITSGGTVSTNVTIANSDRLLITDASDSSKIKGGVAFGTSTVCYLANNGTWQTPPNTTYSLISEAEIINSASTTARLVSGGRLHYWADECGWVSGATNVDNGIKSTNCIFLKKDYRTLEFRTLVGCGSVSVSTDANEIVFSGETVTVNNCNITITGGTNLSGGDTFSLNQSSPQTITINHPITLAGSSGTPVTLDYGGDISSSVIQSTKDCHIENYINCTYKLPSAPDLGPATATTYFEITNSVGINACISGATNTYAGLVTTGNQLWAGSKCSTILCGTTCIQSALFCGDGTGINVGTTSGCLVSTTTSGRLTTLPSNTYAPLSHAHGNINNGGCIGSTSGLIVVTTTNGCLTTTASTTYDNYNCWIVGDTNANCTANVNSGNSVLFSGGTGMNTPVIIGSAGIYCVAYSVDTNCFDKYQYWTLKCSIADTGVDINSTDSAIFIGGTNVSLARTSNCITINATDTNTATAADNILDGSNIGTEITYAAYTTSQATLTRFYTHNTAPTGTGLLNLGSCFRATELYEGSTRVLTSETDPKGVASAAFSGTTTKTLTLTLNDTTTVQANFTDNNTTYTEISEAEIDAGTATTLRSISGRRAGYIVGKSAALTHVHGEITSGGTVSTNVTIANTDRILISDASDSSKIKGGVAFGTSTTTFLANNGTWQTPAGTIQNLGVTTATTTNTITIDGGGTDAILNGATTSAAGLVTTGNQLWAGSKCTTLFCGTTSIESPTIRGTTLCGTTLISGATICASDIVYANTKLDTNLIEFRTGDDRRIRFDSSSIGVGSNVDIQGQPGAGGDGNVNLYNGTNLKISTSTTGATITGAIRITGGGTPAAGCVLTAINESGDACWCTPASGGGISARLSNSTLTGAVCYAGTTATNGGFWGCATTYPSSITAHTHTLNFGGTYRASKIEIGHPTICNNSETLVVYGNGTQSTSGTNPTMRIHGFSNTHSLDLRYDGAYNLEVFNDTTTARNFIIRGGSISTTSTGGDLTLCGGSGGSTSGNGGDLILCGGLGNGLGINGNVIVSGVNVDVRASGEFTVCRGAAIRYITSSTGSLLCTRADSPIFCGTTCMRTATMCATTSYQTTGTGVRINANTGCGSAVDWIATSDCRVKTNIQPISNALSMVTQLCGVCYELCNDEKHENNVGLIAQDVENILPEVVSKNEPSEEDIEKFGITDIKYGLKYNKLTAVLIEAIKEQQKQIEELKNKIEQIEKGN